ncbi:MerR family transcriptional regulator [Pseudomonas syringae pv. aptata]|jgi:DNA-binding transcriptional MerR regulator|uniref:Transcriptional regulator, MerR family n=6 Tax=Pseudomonas syringae group TaxID=136849 RepID=A0AAQ1L307_PSESX|nr:MULTISPECIES: MerR family transcriptional regulator [Pseudomonas]ALU59224.1 helix-turn-helix-type transcriptional regulator [Pseudomonas syringae pv. lapsa]AZG85212.1 MerR family transcriptional regulator [Pseudomonas syringae pv. pisi str. PP1]ELQ03832.1 regulatory protein, MerR [Pseudomonas syringae BRIP34876]ELQ03962.1 regulatory protein, MerR [Pseudomonas syringae BRIP34881]ELS44403.1 MerR family transcriptional regulator [Pseudomonas syringae pv. syringae B64]
MNDTDTEVPGDWLPIREVARQTGVNAVTLRAWERRYGLIVPHRTAKGHRLYSDEHVQRVMKILTWLNRGVSVSQVKGLIDDNRQDALPPTNDWDALRQTLLVAIGELAERRVDDVFNQAMSLYPPRTLCEQLLLPLLAELEQRWQGKFGAQLERTFFYSWLRSKFGARIYHNNRQLNGSPLLLVNQSDLPLEPHLWLAAWLVSSADCPVEVFDWPLPVGELALAAEYLKPRGILLYSSKSLNVTHLPRLLANITCPVVLGGPTVQIHNAELLVQAKEISGLTLAHDVLSAQIELGKLGLI